MSHNTNIDILSEVANYYSDKLIQHGDTPLGVDWNGIESQQLRFEQLGRILPTNGGYSVTDLGCGYGALLDYLGSRCHDFTYLGVDVSSEMIMAAKHRYANNPRATFVIAAQPNQMADYVLASGIFNVRQNRSDSEWFDYLQSTLDLLDRTSRAGFSFNCLTSYSDEEKKRDYLYYADPCQLFDLCKRRYSRHVALLHDYGLYEFTVLVRKA